MPAYKKLPQVISAISKILVTGSQANALAKRAFIKAEIEQALRAKELSADEYEKQLTLLVDERLTKYGVGRIGGAPAVTGLRYGNAAMNDVDTRVNAFVESSVALELTLVNQDEIRDKILNANVALEDHDLIDGEEVEEEALPGILLKKIYEKKMSLDVAIKTYYREINKASLQLKYFQTLIPTLSAELQEKIARQFSSVNSDNYFDIHEFFSNEIMSNYVDKFKNEIREEINSNKILPVPAIVESFEYLFYRDECFPLYCANWIKGKNYIAMAGARNNESVAILIHSLLFSETMKNKPKVTTIIALGDCTKSINNYSTSNRADFFNYCYDDREQSNDHNLTTGKSFSVSTQNVKFEVTVNNRSASSNYTGTSGYVFSELEVENRKVEILLLGIPDGYSLDLGIDGEEVEQLKELFWKISQKLATEAVAVHCAAGVGRTGHVILMLEILTNYQRIFASDNPEIIANEIQAIVTNMRETRPALVYSFDQYLSAIVNADILYQYALKKKYLTAPAPLSTVSFLTAAPRSSEEQDLNPKSFTTFFKT